MRGRPRGGARPDPAHCAVVGCVMRATALAFDPFRPGARSVGLCMVHRSWATSRPELFGFAKRPARIVS